MNYDSDKPESIADFILQNLPRHGHFALATTDDQNRPWVVCVNLAFDEKVNFIWRSLTNTEHSKNLLSRPDVSICVFSKTADVGDFGYYCKAVAHEVNDRAEIEKLLVIRYKGREIPPVEQFLGDSPSRLYYAEVTEAWINDDRHIKSPVDLEVLKRKARQNVRLS